eukprot:Clim_evm31s199 gene=Clim_evmTU31s199
MTKSKRKITKNLAKFLDAGSAEAMDTSAENKPLTKVKSSSSTERGASPLAHRMNEVVNGDDEGAPQGSATSLNSTGSKGSTNTLPVVKELSKEGDLWSICSDDLGPLHHSSSYNDIRHSLRDKSKLKHRSFNSIGDATSMHGRDWDDLIAPDHIMVAEYVSKRHVNLAMKGKAKTLTLELAPATFRDDDYALYKKYQMAIHGEDESEISKHSYTNFLVASPLVDVSSDETWNTVGYGTFHQRYLLDGKLIALAILDILPRCVSSVYFIYDPDYGQLSLGTFSALQEIHLTRTLRQTYAPLKFYYLGYYIHSCPKMRYKGQYKPSELLCPATYQWMYLHEAAKLLEKSKYAEFYGTSSRMKTATEGTSIEVDGSDDSDVTLLIGDKLLSLKDLILYRGGPDGVNLPDGSEIDEAIELAREFCLLVGKRLSSQFICQVRNLD